MQGGSLEFDKAVAYGHELEVVGVENELEAQAYYQPDQ